MLYKEDKDLSFSCITLLQQLPNFDVIYDLIKKNFSAIIITLSMNQNGLSELVLQFLCRLQSSPDETQTVVLDFIRANQIQNVISESFLGRNLSDVKKSRYILELLKEMAVSKLISKVPVLTKLTTLLKSNIPDDQKVEVMKILS